ncbi:MAG: SCO family protein [Vicinamibacterales bacterium]
MRNSKLCSVVLVAALGAVVICSQACSRPDSASESAPPTEAPQQELVLQELEFGGDFTLTGHTGQPVSLADFRGRTVLIFFGFTHCPDVCPLTMSKITTALGELGEAKKDVQVLFVTVDVDRDTPEQMANYVKSYDAPLTGLTGTREEVDRVVSAYKASYEITPSDSAGGPQVSHTAYTYLVDRTGKLRHAFRYGDSPQTIAEGIKMVMAAS